jgi:DNA-binding FrmR family transcriptional regulator
MVEMVTSLQPRLAVPAVVGRLRRIEGQACALNRMYEEGRSAEDLVDQIAALRGALLGLGLVIAGHEIAGRVAADPLRASSPSTRAAEASTLLPRLVRP